MYVEDRRRAALWRTLTLAALAALGGCTSFMQPQEDPVLIKLTELERRLVEVERSMQNQSLLEVVNQLERMDGEIRALRGSIESTDNEVAGVRQRQRELFVQLDQRLARMESGAISAPVAGTMPGETIEGLEAAAAGEPAPIAGSSDNDIYNAAFDLLKEGRYEEAGQGFKQLLDTMPDSSLAPNSQYWYAETLYVRQRFSEALPEFRRVVDTYPRSQKVPDAQLKIGYCLYELQQWTEARTALRLVTERYENSTAARFATQRLDKMRREGH